MILQLFKISIDLYVFKILIVFCNFLKYITIYNFFLRVATFLIFPFFPLSQMEGRNLDNPFVRNIYHFDNALDYNETLLAMVHKWCNILVFCLGAFFVALLTFLIFRKTPPHFSPYSKMVFLCVVTDSIILMADFLCQSVSFFGWFRGKMGGN